MDRKTKIKLTARPRYKRPVGAAITALGIWLLTATFTSPAAAMDRRLAFAVEGVIETILVRPGQRVAKGAPLAKLDLRPLTAAAKAAKISAKATEQALDLARINAEQVTQLYDDLSTSKEAVDLAQSRFAAAEAAHGEASARSVIAEWRLERATLSAPVAGKIKSIPGYIGLVVTPAARFTPVVVMN